MSLTARRTGALAHGCAAGITALGVLVLSGDGLEVKTIREAVPLAVLTGMAAGYATVRIWPRHMTRAVLGSIRTGALILLAFCALYLAGDVMIETGRGGAPAVALGEAAGRLMARLPMAILLAVMSFAASGAALRALSPRTDATRSHPSRSRA